MKLWRRVYGDGDGYAYGPRRNGDHESNTRLLAATSSSRDTDVDVAETLEQSQHPITLTQPPAYQSHHDSEGSTSSADNSESNVNSHHQTNHNINNHHYNTNTNNNNNNNSPTTHGTFLTTPNTFPLSAPSSQSQLPPSTTKRYLRVLHDTQLPTTFLKNHMHEIVVVGLFLLIPVTLALVEIIERVGLGVDEGVELEDYLQMKRGRGMIRRGRGRRVFRKKKGKGKGKNKLKFLEMDVDVDIEDQALYR
ncbi:hypothetical protein BDV40DRAFT_301906 [Aspergillus tamarii]|uniref:Uncharacterized protein n=1 Tax=Aspergillus tamarii TaxID=41984 RepID=A0A5N6UQ81_ASPTM|nr:hypothetical protein BDV40DRAFT_301906 [Aspergillus tamarii]